MLHRRALRFAFVAALGILGACASSSGPSKNDMGARTFCPDNPQFCGEGSTCCPGNTSCVDTRFSQKNCGACGVECTNGELCGGGTCGCPVGPGNVMKCPNGQSCCGANGCKNLMTDTKNCGQCGNACGVGATCAGGQCLCGGRTCGVGEVCCNGTCSTMCAIDMAVPRDMAGGGGSCVCSAGCASGLCLGNDCCWEDAFFGLCTPDPACFPM
jgi:hypothetical protein